MTTFPYKTLKPGIKILAWCRHEDDPYVENEETGRLTLYAAHAEIGDHADDGPHVLEWGGAFDDSHWEDTFSSSLPDWWFVSGSDFEKPANPVSWFMILPEELP